MGRIGWKAGKKGIKRRNISLTERHPPDSFRIVFVDNMDAIKEALVAVLALFALRFSAREGGAGNVVGSAAGVLMVTTDPTFGTPIISAF